MTTTPTVEEFECWQALTPDDVAWLRGHGWRTQSDPGAPRTWQIRPDGSRVPEILVVHPDGFWTTA